MRDLLTKYCQSEIRLMKKARRKPHPRDIEKKNSDVFSKSFFGKRNLIKK